MTSLRADPSQSRRSFPAYLHPLPGCETHSDQNDHDVHEPSAVEHPESQSAGDADRASCPGSDQARCSIARRAVRISLSQINIRPALDS
jgi:hypothetical protein